MIYALPGKLDEHLQQTLAHDFTTAFDVQLTLRSTSAGPEEPFGFVDGVSQPVIDWAQSIGGYAREREEYNNLLAAGEVLLGYPNEYGLFTQRPWFQVTRPTRKFCPRRSINPSKKTWAQWQLPGAAATDAGRPVLLAVYRRAIRRGRRASRATRRGHGRKAPRRHIPGSPCNGADCRHGRRQPVQF